MSSSVGDKIDTVRPVGGKNAGITVSSASVGDTVLVRRSQYGYPVSSAAVGDKVVVKRLNGKLVGISGGDPDVRSNMLAEGMAISANGTIYQAWNGYALTPQTGFVKRYSANGQFQGKIGSFGTANGQFNTPHTLAIDSLGNVYVVDMRNYRIQKFTSSGAFITAWGDSSMFSGDVAGIAIDDDDFVYVVDRAAHRALKFTSAGVHVLSWNITESSFGCAISPSTGNLWIVVTGYNRFEEWTNTGTYVSTWGTEGSGDGQLIYPYDLAFDSHGDVYVTDRNNFRIQKFSEFGTYLGVKWGTEGSGDGQFEYAAHVAVNKLTNNVYVGDNDNYRVQQFSPTGAFIRKWYSGR